jgi:septum formation protein
MKEAGFTFEVIKPDVEESFPPELPVDQVARYVAMRKAEYFRPTIKDEVVLTADTVVIINGTILNKPVDRADAIRMLSILSGNTHTVMTGVCLMSKEKEDVFDDTTEVTFKSLHRADIEYYVDHYKPFDKAGSYGAQDWIGLVAVERIDGSYFNVMGLPVHKVYDRLQAFAL